MTVRLQAEPIAMFGCVLYSIPVRYGGVWLLGSDGVNTIRWKFLRESRKWLDVITQGCQVSGNVVDSRNELHVKWIRWLGYKFLRRLRLGGAEFLEFAKTHV